MPANAENPPIQKKNARDIRSKIFFVAKSEPLKPEAMMSKEQPEINSRLTPTIFRKGNQSRLQGGENFFKSSAKVAFSCFPSVWMEKINIKKTAKFITFQFSGDTD